MKDIKDLFIKNGVPEEKWSLYQRYYTICIEQLHSLLMEEILIGVEGWEEKETKQQEKCCNITKGII